MTTFNTGSLFQREYESDSNALRRFLIANHGTPIKTIRQALGGKIKRDNFVDLVNTIQWDESHAKKPWMKHDDWLNINYFHKSKPYIFGYDYQCPECAKEIFHSHLFGFSWLKNCPIHGCEITSECPDCGKPWSSFVPYESNTCPTCGWLFSSPLKLRERHTRKHTKKEHNVLSRFWEMTKISSYFDFMLYCDYVENGVELGLLNGDANFPELAISFYPQDRSLFKKVGISCSALKSLDFAVKPVSRSQIKSLPLNYDPENTFSKKTIDEVEKQIVSYLNLPKKGTRIVCLDSDHFYDYNADELSLKIWRNVALSLVDEDLERPWWNKVFDALGIPRPNKPPIAHLIISRNMRCFYEPCIEFKSWMLEQHLVNLFIYIFKHVSQFKRIINMGDAVRRVNNWNKEFVLWRPNYNAFRLKIFNGSILRVVYKPFPRLRGLLHHERLDEYLSKNSIEYDWQGLFARHYAASTYDNLFDAITRTPEVPYKPSDKKYDYREENEYFGRYKRQVGEHWP